MVLCHSHHHTTSKPLSPVQFFEKTSWLVSAGDEMMYVDLQWVRISEFPSHPTTHH